VLRICDNLAGRISKGLLKDARSASFGLFDAVDRTPRSPQTTTISSVVGVCAHAVRSRWTLNRLWFDNTGAATAPSTPAARAATARVRRTRMNGARRLSSEIIGAIPVRIFHLKW